MNRGVPSDPAGARPAESPVVPAAPELFRGADKPPSARIPGEKAMMTVRKSTKNRAPLAREKRLLRAECLAQVRRDLAHENGETTLRYLAGLKDPLRLRHGLNRLAS